MVDSAVTRFGKWAESKLHETDDKYKPRWTAAQLLMEPEEMALDLTGAPTQQMVAAGGDDWSAFLDEQGGVF